jgi:replicative DNA helicase
METRKNPGSSTNRAVNDFDRVQPQALELEEAVIAACLIERDAYDTASTILTAEMLYDPKLQIIFTAIGELIKENRPVDILTVKQKVQTMGLLDAAGGAFYITSVSGKLASAAHLETHCRIVKDLYIKRRLIVIGAQLQTQGFDQTTDPDDIITALERQLMELQELLAGATDVMHISYAVKRAMTELQRRMECHRQGITPGIDTGFARLNRLTGGWQEEDLIVIAARPGVGKTAIGAIFMALQAARQGVPVAIFALEMSARRLADRILVGQTAGVGKDEFNAGSLTDEQFQAVNDTAAQTSLAPIYIDDGTNLSATDIAAKARLLKKQGRCGMIIVDYLQLIAAASSRDRRTREQEVSEMSRTLKLTAKGLHVPVIVLSQMNRAIENEDRDPQLSDLRESGAIEQDADIVIFIQRKGMHGREVFDKQGRDISARIDLFVRKSREGALGVVYLAQDGTMTNFREWTEADFRAAEAAEVAAEAAAGRALAKKKTPPPAPLALPFIESKEVAEQEQSKEAEKDEQGKEGQL